jgi:hypothetical protein
MDTGNPYQSPLGPSLAEHESLIPKAALPLLRKGVRTQRIIILGLVAGVTIFIFYILSIERNKFSIAQHFSPSQTYPLLIAFVAIVLSFVLHHLVMRYYRPYSTDYSAFGPLDDASHAAVTVLLRLQMAMLIPCLLMSLAAYSNAYGFLTSGEVLNLIAVVLLLALMLIYFPRWNATLGRIERELRNQQQGIG